MEPIAVSFRVLAMNEQQAELEALVSRYERPLRRFLFGVVQDADLAADLCQDVLLAVCQSVERLSAMADPAPWLYTVALNRARASLRRQHVLRWVRWLPGLHEPAASGDMAADLALRDELREILGRLPLEQRACLVLWADGFRYKEIAEVLGCTTDAVRLRLFRARQACRAAFSRGAT